MLYSPPLEAELQFACNSHGPEWTSRTGVVSAPLEAGALTGIPSLPKHYYPSC